MKTQIIILASIFALSTVFFSCQKKKEGCTDPLALNYDPEAEVSDGNCQYKSEGKLTFTFTHNFDGTAVTANDYNEFNYVNENDDTLSISKLRYLISDIRLYTSNGDSVLIDGYQLVDLSDNNTLTYSPTTEIPFDSYTNIAFTFGFDSLDNQGNYTDLNSASWNWPAMIGGGYHFMQMEGKYKEQGNDSLYAYHMGTAHNMMTSETTQNYFVADLGAIQIASEATVEIKMDIAEWYKNPNTWDLNAMHSGLMMNYNAQRTMNANGATVFSLGSVN